MPPSDILAFQDTYLTTLRTHLAENLKKRDKAKERRVDKILAASRKKLEENDGKVKIRGASTYALSSLTSSQSVVKVGDSACGPFVVRGYYDRLVLRRSSSRRLPEPRAARCAHSASYDIITPRRSIHF